MRLIALALALLPLAAAPAGAAEPALAGTWVAVDDVHPRLWDAGLVIPGEELLVIQPDGRVENRLLHMLAPDAYFCRELSACSDAPLIRSGRLVVDGRRLTFTGLTLGTPTANPPEGTELIRARVVTRRDSWRIEALEAGRLELSGAGRRRFARVDLVTLGRWRAAFLAYGVSARLHWRCFLANMTAGDPAFAALRGAGNGARPPEWFPAFMKGASWLESAAALTLLPTPDDPDPEVRAVAGHPFEHVAFERFPELERPRSKADAERLATLHGFIRIRAHAGLSDAEARAAVAKAGPLAEVPPLSVGEAEIAALSRFKDDPAAQALACPEKAEQ